MSFGCDFNIKLDVVFFDNLNIKQSAIQSLFLKDFTIAVINYYEVQGRHINTHPADQQ